MSSGNSAVIDGVLQHVSPSQIQTFDAGTFGGCERKWYYEKVEGLETPTTKGQAIGSATHGEVENYLETGVDSLGLIARSGKHFLPEPRVYLLVEHDAKGLVAAGVPVKMRIDAVNYSGTYRDNEGVAHDDRGTVEVIDWKTTSSMAYAKTAPELREAIQMLTYGEWVRSVKWDISASGPTRPDRIRLSHGVFCTGARVARKTTVTIGVNEVADKWQNRIVPIVERMKVTARAPKVEDVEPNRPACDAYRGCHFRAVCPRSPGEALSFLGGNMSGTSLFQRLKNPATLTVVEPAGERVIVKTDDPKVIAAEVAKLEAEERAAKAPALVRAVGVVPPDAIVSLPPASAEPIPPETLMTMSPAIQEAAKPFAAPVTAPTTPEPAPAIGDPPVKKRGPGRPPKVKPVSTEPAAPSYAERAAAPTVEVAPVAAKDPDAGFDAGPGGQETHCDMAAENAARAAAPTEYVTPGIVFGFDLYVDVITSGVAANDLEPYIVAKCRALEAEFKAADIRCAPGDSPLGFGKWKGALASVVRAVPPPPGAWSISDVRDSEIRQVVVEALRPLATTYIRGR